MYGTEPPYNELQYNEPRLNEILNITNKIWKPKPKLYFYLTNNANAR